MNYKIFAFDLDGTLARSKMEITLEMGEILSKILENHKISIITGGEYGRFEKQIFPFLPKNTKLKNLILEPTSGAQFYIFDGEWKKIYSYDLKKEEKEKILNALNIIIKEFPFENDKKFGDLINDRNTQITYTPVGKDCPIEIKEDWDIDQKKRKVVQKRLMELIPDFKITIGGTTSIDITPIFLDKKYGMEKLMEITKTNFDEVIFFGDKLQEGGNDFPVTKTGIHCIEVKSPADTMIKLKEMI